MSSVRISFPQAHLLSCRPAQAGRCFQRQGRLRLLGLYLVLIGASFMLIEFFQHITFGTPMWVWSLYCVCGFGALGLFLFVATLIPPLHAHLRKTFFF